MNRLGISLLATAMAALALPVLAQESVLYSFNPDGAGNPGARLLVQKNALFGTTGGQAGTDGTVFELKKSGNSWTESTLVTFNGSNGAYPAAGLIVDANGNLYGTTSSASTYNGGTVFELTPSGKGWNFQTIWSFGNTATHDGDYPTCDLLMDSTGAIYGTTAQGGTNNDGTVFKLTQSGGVWTDSVLYSFASGNDGRLPENGLVMDSSGALYGTTIEGGPQGEGVVFELKPNGNNWTESVLHSFGSGMDGETPGYGSLLLTSGGALYGTTTYGGTADWGIAYELTPSGSKWKEKILHNFGTVGGDGDGASGALIKGQSGAMYGTTRLGGVNFDGTVYTLAKVNGSWKESVVYDFPNYTGDAGDPVAGVTLDKKSGRLYGVSAQGGEDGWGSVYQIILP